jgi:5-methylcytosine-specific restriction endonuclease McrA
VNLDEAWLVDAEKAREICRSRPHEVIEGGGECKLENLRTLCTDCHKQVTANLRRRMALQARDKRAVENDRNGLFGDQVGE